MDGNTERKRLVIIGGGTGLSTLLRGLKLMPLDLTAIVTVADDGGSSGRLRNDLDIPPPGDIRNVMAALSDTEPLLAEMFQYRFKQSLDLDGHSLGNLMLAALTEITGDFANAVREMSRVLNVNGTVLPAANQLVTLHAELEDGTIVSGESKIPAYLQPIKRVFLQPDDVQTLPDTIAAIEKADLIVVGPGSLYTSILPNLLVKDIRDAVLQASAKKIYICNLMTQAGETYRYSAEDHVQALYDHVGTSFLDGILLEEVRIPETVVKVYKKEKASPVEYDEEQLERMGLAVFRRKITNVYGETVRHEPQKVAQWLYEYVEGKDSETH
ncbi:YvcK family protein [Planomicrobium sp. YIM 101495]|uniref:gluconeogenesis factor YvcK family protein n=1 Tax=Planomicrobium sp. YIM 101495 TaxID=2665160 RepID=UPI0012B7399C|nr:YvcK family protein [Planomicrobium sp. YIM 101495]MTD31681.1 uridine diphosphate-N-acetylglucosamine-binding protein YvcK [Planomicrobium sp. YIM 101495]